MYLPSERIRWGGPGKTLLISKGYTRDFSYMFANRILQSLTRKFLSSGVKGVQILFHSNYPRVSVSRNISTFLTPQCTFTFCELLWRTLLLSEICLRNLSVDRRREDAPGCICEMLMVARVDHRDCWLNARRFLVRFCQARRVANRHLCRSANDA